MRRIDFPEPIEYRPHGGGAPKSVTFPEWISEAIRLTLRAGRDAVLESERLRALFATSTGAALLEEADYQAVGRCLDGVQWDPGLAAVLGPWVRAWNAATVVDVAKMIRAADPDAVPIGDEEDPR